MSVALLGAGCAPAEPRSAASVRASPACDGAELPRAATFPLATGLTPPSARIESVVVRGNRRVPSALVRSAITTRAGQRLDPARLGDDVRRIWELEVFEDVRVEWRARPGGLELGYVVSERPTVASVATRGDSIRARELGVEAGMPYEPERLHVRARELERSLADAGYRNARVRAGGVRRGASVALCISVEPGPPVLIERFEFVGNRHAGADELRAQMHARDAAINRPGGVYRADAIERDLLFWYALYYDRGALSVRITPRVVEAAGALSIRIEIDEGPIFRIGALRVSGERIVPAQRYLELLSVRPGDVFSRRELVAGIARLAELHRSRGRAELDVQPSTKLHPERGIVDVELEVVRR